MDSEHYWEDNCYDTGNWRSIRLCEISEEEPSKSTQATQQQLECTMSHKPEKSAGTGVVVKRGPIEKRPPIPRKPVTPDLTVYVDASDSGWEVSSASVQAAEFWSAEEKEDSINVRELKIILFALKVHLPQYKAILQIYSDNTAALKHVNKAGEHRQRFFKN